MPGNKRRSRNGSSTSSSSSSAAAAAQASLKSSNSFTKFFTNFNGFANGGSYNGYHHPHHPTIAANHHPVNSNTGNSINGTTAAATVNGDGGSGSSSTNSNSNTNIGGSQFTAKQQQQLDRNAFLLTLTKEQLKIECRKRGQKTNGTKTELV